MQTQTTIVGIATPPGNGGVGIVRLSGSRAYEIARFVAPPRNDAFLLPRHATRVTVNVDGVTADAIAIYFNAPHSFTGEDVVELQCHGGYYLLQKIVAGAVKHGAVVATAGEFSMRAFLNGKLSLDMAESIVDIIHAESDLQLRCANKTFSGALRDILGGIEARLIDVTARIEATLDYPEHDIEHSTAADIAPVVGDIIARLRELVATAETGRVIANGINVAVVGRPNVGKSLLFNAILNHDRSIVTPIAGTTTDTITEAINYGGIRIVFHDTAGLRAGGGVIENMGIERTRKIMADCDVVMAIFDASVAPSRDDMELLGSISKPCVVVLNKTDLGVHRGWVDELRVTRYELQTIRVSALTRKNIEKIKETIFVRMISQPISTDKVIITNARHWGELNSALSALSRAYAGMGGGDNGVGGTKNGGLSPTVPLDCIATDVTSALAHIGNITGTNAGEEVLHAIFSRFCLGK